MTLTFPETGSNVVNVILFSLAVIGYLVAGVCYALTWRVGPRRFGRRASTALLVAVAVHGAGIVARWIESGYPPLSNAFETLSFYGWALAAGYLVLERRLGHRGFGAFVTPIALLAVIAASVLPKTITPLIPVLQSHWLGIHVSISFTAFVIFTLAFAAAVAFVFVDRALKRAGDPGRLNLPSLITLDDLGMQLASLGFVLMSGSLISGSIWAQHAWDTPWVWQPQQVSALVTWLVYAAYLASRGWLHWRGRRSAWMLVGGFAAMVVTFVGVDLMSSGNLHDFLF